jgi:hypothetical protein
MRGHGEKESKIEGKNVSDIREVARGNIEGERKIVRVSERGGEKE